MRLLTVAILVFAASGCASNSVFIEPSNRADRMLLFVEQDRRGKQHPISEDPDNEGAIRIPRPALVDIDSLIHIHVRKPPSAVAQDLFNSEADTIAAEKAAVLELVKKLQDVVEARQRALDAYRDGSEGSELDTLIREAASKTRDFINAFVKRHPRGTEGYRAANRVIGAGGLAMLQPFLQDEIDAIEAQDRRIRERAESRSSQLKLEAFLDTPGGELTALHLPGYDDLAQGRVATRDRYGLKLSEQERAELSRQIKATEDIARTLDQLREKEKSLQVGVQEVVASVAPDLARHIEAAEHIAARLSDPQRIASMKADLQRTVREAKRQVEGLSDSVSARLDALPAALAGAFERQSAALDEILQIVAGARQIERDWDMVRTTSDLDRIPDLLGRTRQLAESIDNAVKQLPAWLTQAGDIAELLVRDAIDGVDSETRKAFADWISSDAVTDTMSDADGYFADLREGAAVATEVGRMLNIGRVDVARAAPEVPEAFYVDIEQLQDTVLDLRRVPGNDGDTILIRARLKDPGRTEVESSSTLELTHYDHYARLVPSVVLVRPDEVASGEDDFRFAPALGWMHHYRPRPEADSWYANVARPLQVAAGMHAIFLNFDNQSGIGLGATISFWNDRLQFGAGWNLSASSSDEGRHYFFVGSDLIGLLQTVGIGN